MQEKIFKIFNKNIKEDQMIYANRVINQDKYSLTMKNQFGYISDEKLLNLKIEKYSRAKSLDLENLGNSNAFKDKIKNFNNNYNDLIRILGSNQNQNFKQEVNLLQAKIDYQISRSSGKRKNGLNPIKIPEASEDMSKTISNSENTNISQTSIYTDSSGINLIDLRNRSKISDSNNSSNLDFKKEKISNRIKSKISQPISAYLCVGSKRNFNSKLLQENKSYRNNKLKKIRIRRIKCNYRKLSNFKLNFVLNKNDISDGKLPANIIILEEPKFSENDETINIPESCNNKLQSIKKNYKFEDAENEIKALKPNEHKHFFKSDITRFESDKSLKFKTDTHLFHVKNKNKPGGHNKLNLNDKENLRTETKKILKSCQSIDMKHINSDKEIIGVNELITSKEQNKMIITERNQEDERLIKSLTNINEINDFYEYTEECMKKLVRFKIPSISDISYLFIDLPFEEELQTKKLAIFDLDETLIHCELKNPQKAQSQIKVNLPSGGQAEVGINIRPHWKECLRDISNNYLIIAFTASHQSYADSVIDYLDPHQELIKYRLYRNHCVKVFVDNDNESSESENKIENEFIYVKDLRIIRNVKLENMIIIDNSILSFSFNLDNGIPILPFYSGNEDNELIFLKNYLNKIYDSQDFRMTNRQTIKLFYFYNSMKDSLKNKNKILTLESDSSRLGPNKESNNNLTSHKIFLQTNEEKNDSEKYSNSSIISLVNSKCASDTFLKNESSDNIFALKNEDLKTNESISESYITQSSANTPNVSSKDVVKNMNIKNILNCSKCNEEGFLDNDSLEKKPNNPGFSDKSKININSNFDQFSPIKRKNNISSFKYQLLLLFEELRGFHQHEK